MKSGKSKTPKPWKSRKYYSEFSYFHFLISDLRISEKDFRVFQVFDLAITQSKINLSFWFINVLDMTNSAFHKVYYKFTSTIKVVKDVVSFFSNIACKTAWM